jgi:anti-anti-sigma factor
MKTTVKHFDKWDIVVIQGKFVLKHFAQIKKILGTLEQSEHPFIAFDFSMLTHMDSSAITLIVNYHQKLTSKKGRLVLFGANNDITGILNMVGLDLAVPVFKTIDDFELSVRMNNI